MNQVHQILSVMAAHYSVVVDFPIGDKCSSPNMPHMSFSHRHFILTIRRDSPAYWTTDHVEERPYRPLAWRNTFHVENMLAVRRPCRKLLDGDENFSHYWRVLVYNIRDGTVPPKFLYLLV